jgi:hypothetical protein
VPSADLAVAEQVQDALDYLLELDEVDEQTYRRVSSSFSAQALKRLSMTGALPVHVEAAAAAVVVGDASMEVTGAAEDAITAEPVSAEGMRNCCILTCLRRSVTKVRPTLITSQLAILSLRTLPWPPTAAARACPWRPPTPPLCRRARRCRAAWWARWTCSQPCATTWPPSQSSSGRVSMKYIFKRR